MRIDKINVSFGSLVQLETLGYDDEISQQKRSFIREHIWDTIKPYQDIYEKSPRLTDKQMEEMLKPLLHPSTESIGNKSFRGPSLIDSPDALKKLKEAGIDCIIDLKGYSDYKEAVKRAGLEYMDIHNINAFDHVAYKSLDDYIFKIIKLDKYWREHEKAAIDTPPLDPKILKERFYKESRPFVDKFIKFVQRMQKGHCYIGCIFGSYTTNDALRLYKVFSPTPVPFDVPQISFEDSYKFEPIKNLYDKLTVEDKKALGWSDEMIKNMNRECIISNLYRRAIKVV